MASDKKNNRELEVGWIRELAEILDDTGLTEIEIEKDAVRLRVSKQGGGSAIVAAASCGASRRSCAGPSLIGAGARSAEQ